MPIGSSEMASRFPGMRTAGGAPNPTFAFGSGGGGGGVGGGMGNPFSGVSNPYANDPRSGLQIFGDAMTGFGGGAQAVQQAQAGRAQLEGQGILGQIVQEAMATGQDPIKAVMTSPELPAIMSMPDFPQQLEMLKGLAGERTEVDPHTAKLQAAGIEPGTPDARNALFPPQAGPALPADLQLAQAMGLDMRNPSDQASFAAFQRSQSHGPQAPQAPQEPSAVRTMQFLAEKQGLDLAKPADLVKAIDMANKLGSSTVNQFSVPADHHLAGTNDDGSPRVEVIEGSKTDIERKTTVQGREKAAKTLDTVMEAIQLNPGEYGLMAGVKEAGRAVASGVEQLAGAASGIPGASVVGGAAEALREGPLGEPKQGLTRDQSQTMLDRLALDVARSGLSEGDQRAAQQEINNVRAALQSGGVDIPTTLRRLNVVKELIFGQGAPAASSGGARAEDIGEGTQASPTQSGGALKVGDVKKGYRFKGGNPMSQSSWEKQ